MSKPAPQDLDKYIFFNYLIELEFEYFKVCSEQSRIQEAHSSNTNGQSVVAFDHTTAQKNAEEEVVKRLMSFEPNNIKDLEHSIIKYGRKLAHDCAVNKYELEKNKEKIKNFVPGKKNKKGQKKDYKWVDFTKLIEEKKASSSSSERLKLIDDELHGLVQQYYGHVNEILVSALANLIFEFQEKSRNKIKAAGIGALIGISLGAFALGVLGTGFGLYSKNRLEACSFALEKDETNTCNYSGFMAIFVYPLMSFLMDKLAFTPFLFLSWLLLYRGIEKYLRPLSNYFKERSG